MLPDKPHHGTAALRFYPTWHGLSALIVEPVPKKRIFESARETAPLDLRRFRLLQRFVPPPTALLSRLSRCEPLFGQQFDF